MNKDPGLTAEENTESPNSQKARESFAKYYQNVYQYLDEEIKKICEKISKIPQYKRIEEDPELELRRIINETSQHQGEKTELRKLADEAMEIIATQNRIQHVITKLNFPPEQNSEG